MGLKLRDNNRYGRYSANCDKLGKVILERYIYGFSEKIDVYQKGLLLFSGVLDEECCDLAETPYEEDDNGDINIYDYYIKLGKCLKRFK